jgi:hypothetical protein
MALVSRLSSTAAAWSFTTVLGLDEAADASCRLGTSFSVRMRTVRFNARQFYILMGYSLSPETCNIARTYNVLVTSDQKSLALYIYPNPLRVRNPGTRLGALPLARGAQYLSKCHRLLRLAFVGSAFETILLSQSTLEDCHIRCGCLVTSMKCAHPQNAKHFIHRYLRQRLALSLPGSGHSSIVSSKHCARPGLQLAQFLWQNGRYPQHTHRVLTSIMNMLLLCSVLGASCAFSESVDWWQLWLIRRSNPVNLTRSLFPSPPCR